MPKIKVIRFRENAKLPERTHDTDTGYDVFCSDVKLVTDPKGRNQLVVYTGIGVQPEPGYYIEVFPRSSICKKYAQLANSVAIIDETYTGEILLYFNGLPEHINNAGYPVNSSFNIKIGEKIAQLVVRKRIDAEFIEVASFDETARGFGGFGSTGVGV